MPNTPDNNPLTSSGPEPVHVTPGDADIRGLRWVAEVDTDDVLTRDQLIPDDAPMGMWGEAWKHLRRRPMFWIASLIILFVILLAGTVHQP